jgi:hypothetical protein
MGFAREFLSQKLLTIAFLQQFDIVEITNKSLLEVQPT